MSSKSYKYIHLDSRDKLLNVAHGDTSLADFQCLLNYHPIKNVTRVAVSHVSLPNTFFNIDAEQHTDFLTFKLHIDDTEETLRVDLKEADGFGNHYNPSTFFNHITDKITRAITSLTASFQLFSIEAKTTFPRGATGDNGSIFIEFEYRYTGTGTTIAVALAGEDIDTTDNQVLPIELGFVKDRQVINYADTYDVSDPRWITLTAPVNAGDPFEGSLIAEYQTRIFQQQVFFINSPELSSHNVLVPHHNKEAKLENHLLVVPVTGNRGEYINYTPPQLLWNECRMNSLNHFTIGLRNHLNRKFSSKSIQGFRLTLIVEYESPVERYEQESLLYSQLGYSKAHRVN